MAVLPESINHTTDAIYRAIAQRVRQGDSRGVGMSQAGEQCERAVWYRLRWAAPLETITGQKERIFETGRREEERLLADLAAAGVQVDTVDPATGRQFTVALANGWLRGKVDGLCLGLPEAPKTWHVVETKSHKQESFKELLKHAPSKGEGLRRSKPDHFAQVQLYLLGLGLTRALYLAVNKNTEELYAERVEFDATFALALEARIERIWSSDKAPPRLWDDPAARGAFACSWCPAKAQCHDGAFARVNCRTCLSARFDAGANVFCTLHQKELSYNEQRVGCDQHLFLPSLVPATQTDANPDARTVTYQLADGTTWIDGLRRNPAEADDDFGKSLNVGYDAIRSRIAAGGPKGWAEEDKK